MEDELIARAQEGDAAAFRELVERYGGVAWRAARVLLGDRAGVEDAAQEAWLDVWQSLHRFELSRPFRPWLLTLLGNRCRMMARRRTLAVMPPTADDADVPMGDGNASDPALRRETGDELRTALAGLLPDQRRVVEVREVAELDLAEIATITGVRVGTVKSRLHRALGAIRAALRDDCDPIPERGKLA